MGLTKSIPAGGDKLLSENGFTYSGRDFFKFVDMDIKIKRPLIFFDLETTGLSISSDRIVQISVTKLFPDGPPITKTRLINPEMPIPKEASDIHGITDEDVKDEPTFSELANSMSEFFAGSDLAGYNLNKFDIPLLVEEFLRCDIKFPEKDVKILDIYRLVCLVFPRNLKDIFEFLTDNRADKAHCAEYDNMMCSEVLSAMLSKRTYTITPFSKLSNDFDELVEKSNHDLHRYVDYAGKITMSDSGDYLFNFGKHKGQSVYKHKDFCKWMLLQDFTRDTKQKLIDIWKLKNENL